eukprot:448923_1
MTTHSLNLFNNNRHQLCQQDDVLKCNSVERIKIVIVKFNEAINDFDQQTKHQNSKGLLQIIDEIFIQNNYTHTDLLNDYHHIKYFHNADNNDNIFAKIYEYCTNHIQIACNVSKCKLVQRHYRDRSTPSNQYIFEHHNDNYKIELISRIHVYFIHSYDINRLTLDEIELIDKLPQQEQITKTIHIIKEKKKKLNIVCRNKCAEVKDEVDFKHNFIDFHAICQRVNNAVEETALRMAFSEYKDDKNQFIADVIDAYYANDDEQLPLENKISVTNFNCTRKTRKQIYECIMQKYVKPNELNNTHFIKIALAIIREMSSQIDIEQFKTIARESNINGKIFVKQHPQFKNSVKFANMFKKINGYNKKHLSAIYVKIRKGNWFFSAVKSLPEHNKNTININTHPHDAHVTGIHEETKKNDETDVENTESKIDNNHKNIEIYNLGTRFYFWDCMKQHKHYIKQKHANLKDEMLQNKVIDFDIQRWQDLENEVKVLVQTDEVKHVKSNGYWQTIYRIDLNSPFTVQHLTSLKLYTDYTTECGKFCSILRSENMTMIAEIANWVKLLTECVQCYGTRIQKKKYYRGVKNVFNFEMFAVRFNLPTSTTTNLQTAFEFSDGSGLVLELKKYRERYDAYKLDCWKFSAFDERETLFFGGNTVLQISSIWQWYDRKWTGYTKYITPLNAISRMIHGLSIRHEEYPLNDNQQNTMSELLNHVFYTFNSQKSMMKLPKYIDQLLQCQASTHTINLNFEELTTDCQWMSKLFVKENTGNYDRNIINIANVCKLFINSDVITFMMPKDYVLSYDECIWLIKDFTEISAFDILVRIKFEWPQEMPILNKSHIDQYQHDLKQIQWKRYFSTNSVSFECIGESVAVQKFIESQLYCIYTTILQPENSNKNSYSIACRKIDINLYCISVVNAFINEFERKTSTCRINQDIMDLILFFYAKPIAIKIEYRNETKHFLLCVVSDEWDSIKLKIIYTFRHLSGIESLTYEYGGKSRYVSQYNCRTRLLENSDKTFTVVESDKTSNMEPTGLIARIDKGLGEYYEYVSPSRKSYYNADGIGKFALFCNDNAFEDDDVKEELTETDGDEC